MRSDASHRIVTVSFLAADWKSAADWKNDLAIIVRTV